MDAVTPAVTPRVSCGPLPAARKVHEAGERVPDLRDAAPEEGLRAMAEKRHHGGDLSMPAATCPPGTSPPSPFPPSTSPIGPGSSR